MPTKTLSVTLKILSYILRIQFWDSQKAKYQSRTKTLNIYSCLRSWFELSPQCGLLHPKLLCASNHLFFSGTLAVGGMMMRDCLGPLLCIASSGQCCTIVLDRGRLRCPSRCQMNLSERLTAPITYFPNLVQHIVQNIINTLQLYPIGFPQL